MARMMNKSEIDSVDNALRGLFVAHQCILSDLSVLHACVQKIANNIPEIKKLYGIGKMQQKEGRKAVVRRYKTKTTRRNSPRMEVKKGTGK